MKSSVSFELFKPKTEDGNVDSEDVFQKVIKYHQEYGINFKKSVYTPKTQWLKLKLWKTMTGNCL